jgi:hypothetical protein
LHLSQLTQMGLLLLQRLRSLKSTVQLLLQVVILRKQLPEGCWENRWQDTTGISVLLLPPLLLLLLLLCGC